MKRTFAIPTEGGKSCAHFGHCEGFALLEVDERNITREWMLTPPVHKPGAYPKFLADEGVTIVIAGGMGAMAQNLFKQNNIEVRMGVGVEAPRELVEKFLRDELGAGENLCTHGEDGESNHECRH